MLRYYINNFIDGFRQVILSGLVSAFFQLNVKQLLNLNKDSIDLVLGNYKVMSNEGIQIEKCPVANDNSTRLLAVS
jgi:hypothetical protein